MKDCKEIYLIGPGRSKLNYDTSKLKNKVILNFSGDLMWFNKNNIYPTYWTFLDPNSIIYLFDRMGINNFSSLLPIEKNTQNEKYNSKWLDGLKNHTNIMFHDFQGTDEFYKKGFSTSRGPGWNKNEFGDKILPKICSFFKETIKLPIDILENNFDPLYTPETYNLSPIIRQGPGINTDKFVCFILPLVLSYFKNLESIKCIGFGSFNEPRLYNNLNLGYEGYKLSYSNIKDKLVKLLNHRNISIKFENKDSYFVELENFTKKENMEKITFCIPSKDNLRYLKTCIPSIRKYAWRKDHDIIVFVDSDNDGTVEWLDEVKEEYNIQYYVNPRLGYELYGIGRAYDYCIEKSTTDIFMIFHADMMLGRDADLKAFNHLKPKTVVCSTRVEPPLHPNNGEKILEDFGIWPEEFQELEFDNYVNQCLSETKVTEGIFAPWMMYKDEFLALGGHDPIMHSCREDSDLFNRMHLADFKFIQPWNSLVYHLTGRGAGSFDGDPEQHKKWQADMNKSTLEFIRKWGQNVNHTPLMKPIVSPKYDIGFIVKKCNSNLLEALEPWCNTIYVEDDMQVLTTHYLDKEQPNTSFNLNERIKPFDNEKNNEILVTIDGNKFTQQDFQYIQQLSEILNDSGEPAFHGKLGNITVEIFETMNTFEKELIICKN